MADGDNEQDDRREAPKETIINWGTAFSRWLGCFDCCTSNEALENGHENLRLGVVKSRACTDLPCLAALGLCCILIWTVIALPAYESGTLDMWRGAQDYNKGVCGVSEGLEDLKWGIFVWPTDYEMVKCFSSCDDTNTIFGYESKEFIYWCLPIDPGSAAFQAYTDYMDSLGVGELMLDMYKERWILVYALATTLVVTMVWFGILYFCLKIIFWVTAVGLVLGCGLGANILMANGMDDEASFYGGVALLVFGGLVGCCILCCFNSINEVLDVCTKASGAILLLPEVMITPFIIMPFTICVIILWYMLTLALYSEGSYSEIALDSSLITFDNGLGGGVALYAGVNQYKYEFIVETEAKNETWVVLFWMFWSLKFLEYFAFFVVAGTVADWYLDKELVDNPNNGGETNCCCCDFLPCFSIYRWIGSLWRTVRYHLGTIAFASLIIALLQTAQAIVNYLLEKLLGHDNAVARCVFCVVNSVFECIKCIVDRCNKTTLCVTAILGYPFCSGCMKSMEMFFSNAVFMALANTFIWYLNFIGAFLIAIIAGALAVIVHSGGFTTDLGDLEVTSMLPGFGVSFVIAYFTCGLFLNVWDTAATSIMVSFILIKSWYPGEGKDEFEMYSKRSKGEVEMANVDIQVADKGQAV